MQSHQTPAYQSKTLQFFSFDSTFNSCKIQKDEVWVEAVMLNESLLAKSWFSTTKISNPSGYVTSLTHSKSPPLAFWDEIPNTHLDETCYDFKWVKFPIQNVERFSTWQIMQCISTLRKPVWKLHRKKLCQHLQHLPICLCGFGSACDGNWLSSLQNFLSQGHFFVVKHVNLNPIFHVQRLQAHHHLIWHFQW